MRRVIVESPYAGPDEQTIARNESYARAALSDCLARGESPFASHLLYTQPGVLDDGDPYERERGILAGFAWGETAEAIAVYIDLGNTPGMKQGIIHYQRLGIPIEYRSIPGWAE